MKTRHFVGAFHFIILAIPVLAVDHRVEMNAEGPPKDELAAGIASQLQPNGFKVLRGTSRTVCEIWLCKQWDVDPGFKPTDEVQYPFKPGQLIGVARYPRKGGDFRDQDIRSGVYTLRYAQQPIDGAHIGTSPTRDFLLLVSAENDQSPADLDMEALIEQSAESAQSSHPAMLCMQSVKAEAIDEPTIRHNEEDDWWIVTISGNTKSGDATKKLNIDFVVVGVATE